MNIVCACVRGSRAGLSARARARAGAAALLVAKRTKGDYGFNVFHNSNPQHGGSYARHERRMRDDEVEDFLRSVKGWSPVCDTLTEAGVTPAAASSSSSMEDDLGGDRPDAPPAPSPLQMGEEAIMRTFHFHAYRDAYLFVGRLWAFCYGSDKYPHVVWEGCEVTVYLYSPSFRGLSKREARMAAFLNDQFNMLKKSQKQQQLVVDTIAKTATVETLVGASVSRALAEREAQRRAPLPESKKGPTHWAELLAPAQRGDGKRHGQPVDGAH